MDKGRVRPGEIEETTRFLSSHEVLQHEGEWVAVLDGSVLAHHPDFGVVYTAAMKKAGDREPLFHLVSSAAYVF
jgi:hypothetical protein